MEFKQFKDNSIFYPRTFIGLEFIQFIQAALATADISIIKLSVA